MAASVIAEKLNIPIILESVSPNVGFIGGSLITITGWGFVEGLKLHAANDGTEICEPGSVSVKSFTKANCISKYGVEV